MSEPDDSAHSRPMARPRRAAWKRILRLFVWLFVLLALLIAFAPFAARGYVQSEIARQLEEGFDARVEIGSCDLSWSSGLTLERLLVKPKRGGAAWIEIGRLHFGPSLVPLLKGRVRWHGTVLEDVVIRGERDANGWAAPRWKQDPGGSSRGGRSRVELDDDLPQLDLDLRIDGLRVEVRDPEWPAPSVIEVEEPIRIHSPGGRTVRVDAVLAPGVACAADLFFERVAANHDLYEPRGKLAITAEGAPLDSFRGLLAPWVGTIAGRAQGQLEYTFTPDALSGGGAIDVAELRVAARDGRELPLPPAVRLQSALSGAPEAARHRADLSAPGLEAQWTLAYEKTELSRSTLASRLDPRAATWLPAHEPLSIDGAALRFDADLEAAAEASLLFRAALDTSRTTFYLGPEGRPLRGCGVLRASGRLFRGASPRIEEGRFEAPGIDASFRGDQRAIEARADLDLGEITTAWIEGLGVGLLASGKGTLAIALARSSSDAPYIGSARFTGERFETLGIDARSVSLEVASLADGGFALREGRAALNGGAVSFAGQLAGESSLSRPFELTVDAKGVALQRGLELEAARVFPLLAGAGASLEATVDLSISLRGDGADPSALLRSVSGDGTLQWPSAVLRPSAAIAEPLALLGLTHELRFESTRLPFAVDGGAIELPPYQLQAGKVALEVAGRTALDGTLDHMVGIRLAGDSSGALGVLLDSRGFLRLPLRGHVSAPRFEMPPARSLVQDGLEEALRRTIDALRKRTVPGKRR